METNAKIEQISQIKADTSRNIYQRMAAVMESVTYVQKQKSAMKYTAVSHDAVTAKLRPAILANGIIATQTVVDIRHQVLEGTKWDYKTKQEKATKIFFTEVVTEIKLTNIDNPEDFVAIRSLGYGIDEQDKGPGKAMSYAFKYGLLKAFMLETGDDPDMDDTTNLSFPGASAQPAPVTAPATGSGNLKEMRIKVMNAFLDSGVLHNDLEAKVGKPAEAWDEADIKGLWTVYKKLNGAK